MGFGFARVQIKGIQISECLLYSYNTCFIGPVPPRSICKITILPDDACDNNGVILHNKKVHIKFTQQGKCLWSMQ